MACDYVLWSGEPIVWDPDPAELVIWVPCATYRTGRRYVVLTGRELLVELLGQPQHVTLFRDEGLSLHTSAEVVLSRRLELELEP